MRIQNLDRRISKRFSKDDRIIDNLLNARFEKNYGSIDFKRLQIDCVKSMEGLAKNYISRGNRRKTVYT